MRLWIKASVTCLMAVSAVFSAYSALSGIKESAGAASLPSYEWSCDEENAEYILREYAGHVGVFEAGGGKTPLTVTDIETNTLREADRNMLGAGIAVADRDELLTLLEDLGS
ncbi:MAG: hypothetical protein EOM54_04095 [Clostridia bacterium]|nr:hypothetical protein [Clostridia bacterium]NCC69012.1 hypothetical protein [Clostridia bacterium]